MRVLAVVGLQIASTFSSSHSTRITTIGSTRPALHGGSHDATSVATIKYRILVRVIDIFGNDTSQAFDVLVK